MMKSLIYILMGLLFLASCVPASEFSQLTDKSTSLQSERDDLMAENEHLTVANREMMAKIDQVEAQQQQNIEDSIRIHTRVQELEQEMASLERKYADLESTHESLLRGNARETRRLLNELQTAQEDLATKERLLKELEASVAGQRQDVNRLTAELEARNARLVEMERMLNEKDRVLDELRERVAEALLGFEGQGLTVTRRDGKVYVSMDEKLLFQSGSTVVDPNGERALRQLSQVLARNPDISIMIEGHTDDVPFRKGSSIKDNWDLSVLRATSIVRILLEGSGIDPTRLTVAGRGEYLPVDPADTPEARRKNRRTEIILSPEGWTAGSDGHDIFLLGLYHFIYLFGVVVGELLDLIFGRLGLILRKPVFLHLLVFLVGFPAAVADAHPGIFPFVFDFLDQIAPAFFGELGDDQADDLSIVGWGDPHVGLHQRLFDGVDHGFFPGLDHDGFGIWCTYIGDLVQGCGSSIVIHQYTVQDVHIRFSRPDTNQLVIKVFDGLLHIFPGHLIYQLDIFVHDLRVSLCGTIYLNFD